MFWIFGHKACVAPQALMEPTSPALEREVLTTDHQWSPQMNVFKSFTLSSK